MEKAKYKDLLKDEDVKRWFENLAAKSYVTPTVYLRTLGLFCELNRTDPKSILRAAGTKDFRDSFSDFVRRLEGEGEGRLLHSEVQEGPPLLVFVQRFER
ncbi:MAG: hypothetical protein B9J98_00685 [Candidatus Terraquivivens tikiterensis]|uniref:Uncharacterized protein n=1 Tax=Candidatus Terraquivivens tikiterensis TaxID=1980982 RepID=A0A2R7YBW8_9ARCH|nr:MAG: hypothetical protein B9J98_00685 [Candidatus Terraquivivens tikiterensis]